MSGPTSGASAQQRTITFELYHPTIETDPSGVNTCLPDLGRPLCDSFKGKGHFTGNLEGSGFAMLRSFRGVVASHISRTFGGLVRTRRLEKVFGPDSESTQVLEVVLQTLAFHAVDPTTGRVAEEPTWTNRDFFKIITSSDKAGCVFAVTAPLLENLATVMTELRSAQSVSARTITSKENFTAALEKRRQECTIPPIREEEEAGQAKHRQLLREHFTSTSRLEAVEEEV